MPRNQAFRTTKQQSDAYAVSLRPVEILYKQPFQLAKPIVLDVPNTKHVLAIKANGGGL